VDKSITIQTKGATPGKQEVEKNFLGQEMTTPQSNQFAIQDLMNNNPEIFQKEASEGGTLVKAPVNFLSQI
jgi:hypothetical protein